MKTPHTHTTEFLQGLAKLRFAPTKGDHHDRRVLERRNDEGYPDLRIHVAYEGEAAPHNISLIKFDGRRSQVIEWESRNLSAHMPSEGLLALIKAA